MKEPLAIKLAVATYFVLTTIVWGFIGYLSSYSDSAFLPYCLLTMTLFLFWIAIGSAAVPDAVRYYYKTIQNE